MASLESRSKARQVEAAMQGIADTFDFQNILAGSDTCSSLVLFVEQRDRISQLHQVA